MNRTAVKSSMLRSVGHDGDVLEVEYLNGAVYRYSGIPRAKFDEMLAAPSIGGYLNHHIKNHCTECLKVVPVHQRPAETKAQAAHA